MLLEPTQNFYLLEHKFKREKQIYFVRINVILTVSIIYHYTISDSIKASLIKYYLSVIKTLSVLHSGFTHRSLDFYKIYLFVSPIYIIKLLALTL